MLSSRSSGTSEAQKSELADAIARNVKNVLGASDASVSVAFEEVDCGVRAERAYRPEIRDKWDQVYKKPGYEM